MKVLLTGATGHIGANVARALLAANHDVVALARERSDRAAIEGLSLELAIGDVLDEASVRTAARGVDAVIHCASEFSIWTNDGASFIRRAVEGTRNVVRAAAAAGARRIVVTGSAASVGASERATDLRSEGDWFEAATVPYYRAKIEAEREATALARTLGVESIILLPTLVLGPHDHRLTPSMRPILDIANGTQPTIDGGLNVVSISDVAAAHVAACTRGTAGERYLVAGENVSFRDLGERIAALTGKMPKHVSVPRWAVRLAATAMEAGSAITGRAPALTRALVDDAFGKWAFVDGTRGRTNFGLDPMGAGPVIESALRWFLDRGLLEVDVARSVRERLTPARAA